ncbi:class I SAM-dependent methyltransferase [Oceanibaculum indicum]|uniref:Methyltransferase family protein n=1 Tax=Oceanibaculum indicum TaxID=526216 RepID=A0A420WGL9_9PROT|nr:class I SAM-dependent methyltransferase [Oceanibaculum indicum]RKQ70127.1 methyltransferase family protein [Oceanibaculum indicum]
MAGESTRQAPAHVVILGLGPSVEAYMDRVKRLGGAHALADEIWAVNALGDVFTCDRIFHMDDVRIQEIRAAAAPDGNIAAMLSWMRKHPGPIYTSRAHEDYPGTIDFPLEAVINSIGFSYFNSTVAYAVAYAIHLGVREISLFGVDYTYANYHHAEKGRACVEFLLGIAAARGIQIALPDSTSLMDACAPKLYGYDTLDVEIDNVDGRARVVFTPHDRLPTAAEIEAEYDHSRHPSPLVKEPASAAPLPEMFGGMPTRANEALYRLLTDYPEVSYILDVGSGDGRHAQIMRDHGRGVVTVSMSPPADHIGDFLDLPDQDKHFEAIWASHVLEHCPDPGAFLRKCHDLLPEGGILAVTVPPAKHEVVGGHVTIWNAGLLLYQMVLAGFDCREARVSGLYADGPGLAPYNISVIVRKRSAELPQLKCDTGDIELLAHLFPVPVTHGFDGRLNPINWH